jgi:hypothetical protein
VEIDLTEVLDGALDELGGLFGRLRGDENEGLGNGVEVMGGALGDEFGFARATMAAEDSLFDTRVEEEALGSVGTEAEEFEREGEGVVEVLDLSEIVLSQKSVLYLQVNGQRGRAGGAAQSFSLYFVLVTRKTRAVNRFTARAARWSNRRRCTR